MSAVRGWSYPDRVAAVTSIADSYGRCGSCRLTPDEAWLVYADLELCPTCEDLDRAAKKIPKQHPEGWRVRIKPVTDALGIELESSAARLTGAGARRRKALKQQRRTRSQ